MYAYVWVEWGYRSTAKRLRCLSRTPTSDGQHIGKRPGDRLVSLDACVLVDELVDKGWGGGREGGGKNNVRKYMYRQYGVEQLISLNNPRISITQIGAQINCFDIKTSVGQYNIF